MRADGRPHIEIDHKRGIIVVGDLEIVHERKSIIEARVEFLEAVQSRTHVLRSSRGG